MAVELQNRPLTSIEEKGGEFYLKRDGFSDSHGPYATADEAVAVADSLGLGAGLTVGDSAAQDKLRKGLEALHKKYPTSMDQANGDFKRERDKLMLECRQAENAARGDDAEADAEYSVQALALQLRIVESDIASAQRAGTSTKALEKKYNGLVADLKAAKAREARGDSASCSVDDLLTLADSFYAKADSASADVAPHLDGKPKDWSVVLVRNEDNEREARVRAMNLSAAQDLAIQKNPDFRVVRASPTNPGPGHLPGGMRDWIVILSRNKDQEKVVKVRASDLSEAQHKAMTGSPGYRIVVARIIK